MKTKFFLTLSFVFLLIGCQFKSKEEQCQKNKKVTLSQDTLNKVTYVNPKSLTASSNYSYATIAPENARMVYVSGINAGSGNGIPKDLGEQMRITFERLETILKEVGSKPECITMIKQYTTRYDREFFDIFLKERSKFMKGAKPSSALIPMAKLPNVNLDIEIELVCFVCD